MKWVCGIADKKTKKICGEEFSSFELLRLHSKFHPKHKRHRKPPPKSHRQMPCEETALRPDFR